MITTAVAIRDALPKTAGTEPDACTWKPKGEKDILDKASTVGTLAPGTEDVRSLRSTLLFGLKGIAAYYTHAAVLGRTDAAITTFIQKGLASTLQDLPVPDIVALVLECGKVGVTVLALLDEANTSAYGKPQITTVRTGVGKRPGILITGHDLKDLEMLLEQSGNAGVDVYTHGEMLPAHAYPAFKKYPHLYGNYGGSWPHQREEFEQFNGPVLFTTNCLVPPKESYKGRLFTTGLTGYPGVPHQATRRGKSFLPIIAFAKTSQPRTLPGVGKDHHRVRHDAVLAHAGRGSGGQDGRSSGSSSWPVAMAQKERGILHGVCEASRRHGHPYRRMRQVPVQCARLGAIGEFPVLDAGQCNVTVTPGGDAQALAKAFGVGINDLPVSYNIAWNEQKAGWSSSPCSPSGERHHAWPELRHSYPPRCWILVGSSTSSPNTRSRPIGRWSGPETPMFFIE